MAQSNQQPEVAVLVSTYQRPQHLRRSLEALRCQDVPAASMEVVVTDDGSVDETPQIVEEFAATVPFRVHWTTHPHTGFHLSRSRNEGVAASTAPYIIFLDGDCLVTQDHVRQHLRYRQPRTVLAGYFYALDQATTEQIDLAAVRRGDFTKNVPAAELRKVRKLDWKARWYNMLHHPTKPKLHGASVGVWRSDYVAINGYDEEFRGWGCEDDDLRLRLRASGVRIRSLVRWAKIYHMWHPPTSSTPVRWKDGLNVRLLEGPPRPVRCHLGLDQHLWDERRETTALCRAG